MRTNDLLYDFARDAGCLAMWTQVRAKHFRACTSLLGSTTFLSQVLAWHQLFAPNVYLVSR